MPSRLRRPLAALVTATLAAALTLVSAGVANAYTTGNTIQQAWDYAVSHPTRDGGSWANWCGSLVFRAGGFEKASNRSADTASLAYEQTVAIDGPANPNSSTAPRGAIHWWTGGDGHVAIDLDGGGSRLLMASVSAIPLTSAHQALGTLSVAAYRAAHPDLTYRGWTPSYIGQRLADYGTGGTPPPAPPTSASNGLILQKVAKAGGYTGPLDGAPGANTWKGVQQAVKGYGYTGPIDGAPGTNTYMAFQRLAAKGGYTGPIDGGLGANSWKGMQTVLRGFGYTGPIDGAPGTNTYAALQRLAKLGGYTGPIDGAPGANTWRGLQRLFTGYGYTGPIDGVPGTGTYTALQRLAVLGGYTGPLDGALGSNTYAALGRLVG
jgi:hypothetical protein